MLCDMSNSDTLRALLPPLALVAALFLVVSAFTLLWLGEPEVDVALHRARLNPDREEYAELLEDQLARRRWGHRVGVGALFTGAVLATAGAFWSMKGR